MDTAVVQTQWQSFLTLPGEQFLLIKRKHWIVIVLPLISISFISSMLLTGLLSATNFFQIALPLLLIGAIFIILMTLCGYYMVLVEWYFHVYLVTTAKIIEIICRPFFMNSINDIRLDQVRCTEIDVRTNGVIKQLFNIGDVIITFDRPTHDEEFIFAAVSGPKEISRFFNNMLDTLYQENTKKQVWYKNKDREYTLVDRLGNFSPINNFVYG